MMAGQVDLSSAKGVHMRKHPLELNAHGLASRGQLHAHRPSQPTLTWSVDSPTPSVTKVQTGGDIC